ncbi:MAG: FAD-binding oxidoreductase, partial [Planctomycetota bacterium]
IEALIDLAEGYPRRVALPLAYWLTGKEVDQAKHLNPAQDGCGLLWYSPLVPMKRNIVAEYVKIVEETCKKHAVEPLITLTSLSDRLFDSTVPILFRQGTDCGLRHAIACIHELEQVLCEQFGCVSYRRRTTSMNSANEPKLASRIKDALDPNRLFAPGRYTS